MNSAGKDDLLVTWCKRKDALWAVDKWHYSTTLPRFKLVCFGAWENRKFVGSVIFGCGATPGIGGEFKVKASQAAELVRVALGPQKQTPTSKIVALAVKQLRKKYTRLRVLVSYADAEQGHIGGIYQAMNWVYLGGRRADHIRLFGKIEHPKSLHSRYGKHGSTVSWLRKHIDANAEHVKVGIKHKYAYALDEQMRELLQSKSKPYPKRVESIDSDAVISPDDSARCNSEVNAPNQVSA